MLISLLSHSPTLFSDISNPNLCTSGTSEILKLSSDNTQNEDLCVGGGHCNECVITGEKATHHTPHPGKK